MLKGKTALVTGSTSGIGLGIAKALAAQGANVILNGFGEEKEIEALRLAIAADHRVPVRYDGADLAQQDQIEAMIAKAIAEFGAIDVLVNNAGIQYVAPIEEFPVDKWNAILAINLTASFHTVRLALPQMKAKGWGRIINIASAHALVASPFKSAYVAAKHGVAGLTKTVALEVAEHGITMNAICPGYVWTPLVQKQIPDTAKARGITEDEEIKNVRLDAQPTKKLVQVYEVAALAALIAGNPPERRVERLHAFWDCVEQSVGAEVNMFGAEFANMLANASTMTRGIPSFFVPNPLSWLGPYTPVGVEAAAYYSTGPLRDTLSELVD